MLMVPNHQKDQPFRNLRVPLLNFSQTQPVVTAQLDVFSDFSADMLLHSTCRSFSTVSTQIIYLNMQQAMLLQFQLADSFLLSQVVTLQTNMNRKTF